MDREVVHYGCVRFCVQPAQKLEPISLFFSYFIALRKTKSQNVKHRRPRRVLSKKGGFRLSEDGNTGLSFNDSFDHADLPKIWLVKNFADKMMNSLQNDWTWRKVTWWIAQQKIHISKNVQLQSIAPGSSCRQKRQQLTLVVCFLQHYFIPIQNQLKSSSGFNRSSYWSVPGMLKSSLKSDRRVLGGLGPWLWDDWFKVLCFAVDSL